MGKSKYKTWLFVNKFISNYHLYLLIILFCILEEKCYFLPDIFNCHKMLQITSNGPLPWGEVIVPPSLHANCKLGKFLVRKEQNHSNCVQGKTNHTYSRVTFTCSFLAFMIIASFYFVLIIIIISGSLQICTGIFWTWIYWKGHGCKLTCSEVLFIHT